VGRQATTRHLLSPDELTGDCDGATHYVAAVEVGATIEADEKSLAAGSASPCRAAHAGDLEPPSSCKTPVAIRLSRIAPLGSLVPFDRAPDGTVASIGTCPEGMVVSEGRCTRLPPDAPQLCAFGDVAGCRASATAAT
jgi:hypothetical protein